MRGRLHRRQFLIAAAALALPHLARAQAPPRPSRLPRHHRKNLTIDYRWAEGAFDAKNSLATELVRQKPDLIFTWGSTATAAAKRATSTIPIVFTWVGDPVGAKLVESLARPGGNLTGMSNSVRDVSAKNVALMIDAVPGLRRLALVRNPDNPNARLLLEEAEAATRARGVEHPVFDVRGPRDFASAFEAMTKERVGAIVFLGDPMITGRRLELAELSLQHVCRRSRTTRSTPRSGASCPTAPTRTRSSTGPRRTWTRC